jgi:hypothetical protein
VNATGVDAPAAPLACRARCEWSRYGQVDTKELMDP